MARITVEDCIETVPNRYELVVLASQRAKDIIAGSPLTLERDNDKDSVISLREIAEKTVDLDMLKEELVQGFSKMQPFDKIDHIASSSEEVAEELEEAQMGMSGDYGSKGGMSFVEENIEVED